jgi:hypothetical protein
MPEWEKFFPEEERKIYEKAGYKGRQSFGHSPALLIIDVILGFTGTKPMEIMEAIEEFPTSCGKVAWEALPNIQRLLHACRAAKIPVVYSTSDPAFKAAFGNATKRAVDETDFEDLSMQFPEMIKPAEAEFVVRKARASAFFGTHLITYLVNKQVDCLLVTERVPAAAYAGQSWTVIPTDFLCFWSRSVSLTALELPIWLIFLR